jgi:hypothetical protein
MTPTSPDPSPFSEAAFAGLFASRLPEFQVPWSVFLLRYSATMRRAVGELDDMLLLVAITIAAAVPFNAARGFAAAPGPYPEGAPPPPTNAVRLAEMTGIPRETVRRRMLAMAARGWVEQSGPPRREWRLSVGPEGWPRVAQEMATVHAGFLHDVARLLGQWDREARKAGWASLTQPPPKPRGAAPLSVPVASAR